MNETAKLKNLIVEAKRTNEFSWLPQIEDEEMLLFVSNDKTIPRENVTDIYSVRAAINEAKGNPIKGFEVLLKNLDRTKFKRISIHRMTEQNGYEYLIFTDPDVEELVGALQLVK